MVAEAASGAIRRMKWPLLLFLVLTCCRPGYAIVNSCDICGRRPSVSKHGGNMPIVGGFNALLGAWPWVVSLQLPTVTGHKHTCGGSLITAQWVLTAAHCFQNKRNLPHWRAVVGASNLSALGSEVHVRFVKQVVLHELYQPGLAVNDVALLELDQPIKCSKYIQPACMPDGSVRLSELTDCYISGWGLTKESAMSPSDVLQESRVNQFSIEKCNSSSWYNGSIQKHNLCAGYEEGGTDTCQGDSGSPLMCREDVSQPFWVIGLTSWGRGCAQPQKPGVYTSTQYFYGWIKQWAGPLPQPPPQPPPSPMPRPPGPQPGVTILYVPTQRTPHPISWAEFHTKSTTEIRPMTQGRIQAESSPTTKPKISTQTEGSTTPKPEIPTQTEASTTPKMEVPAQTEASTTPKTEVLTQTEASTTPKQEVPTQTEASTTPKQEVPTQTEASTTPKQEVPTQTEASTTPKMEVPTETEASTTSKPEVPTQAEASTTPKMEVPTQTEASTTSKPEIPTQAETSTTPKQEVPTQTEASTTPKMEVPTQTEASTTPKQEVPTQTEASTTPKQEVLTQTEASTTPKMEAPAQTETSTTPKMEVPAQTKASTTSKPEVLTQMKASTTPKQEVPTQTEASTTPKMEVPAQTEASTTPKPEIPTQTEASTTPKPKAPSKMEGSPTPMTEAPTKTEGSTTHKPEIPTQAEVEQSTTHRLEVPTQAVIEESTTQTFKVSTQAEMEECTTPEPEGPTQAEVEGHQSTQLPILEGEAEPLCPPEPPPTHEESPQPLSSELEPTGEPKPACLLKHNLTPTPKSEGGSKPLDLLMSKLSLEGGPTHLHTQKTEGGHKPVLQPQPLGKQSAPLFSNRTVKSFLKILQKLLHANKKKGGQGGPKLTEVQLPTEEKGSSLLDLEHPPATNLSVEAGGPCQEKEVSDLPLAKGSPVGIQRA